VNLLESPYLTMTEKRSKSSSASQASLEEQVSRAELVVHKNKAASDTLHGQWKTHLLHLSFLLSFIGLQQLQTRVSPCLKDIKRFNSHQRAMMQDGITSADTLRIALLDSIQCLTALAMTFFLIFFVSSRRHQSRARFSSSFSYMAANACVPILLALNFRQGRDQPGDISCIVDLLNRVGLSAETDDQHHRSTPFPVVLIFHVIVTACVWFMDVQAVQHEKNIQLVEKLRTDLLPEDAQQREPTERTANKAGKQSTAAKDGMANAKDKNA
jgi:hypothetical protein